MFTLCVLERTKERLSVSFFKARPPSVLSKIPFAYIISISVPNIIDVFWENAVSGKHHICMWERSGREGTRGSGSVKICNLIWSSGEDYWVHSVGRAGADCEFWSNARQVQKTKSRRERSVLPHLVWFYKITNAPKNDKVRCLCPGLGDRVPRFLKPCCSTVQVEDIYTSVLKCPKHNLHFLSFHHLAFVFFWGKSKKKTKHNINEVK